MIKVLLIAALCVAAAQANSYNWAGCDTNFANPHNWDSSLGSEKLPYGNSVPPTTVYIASTTNCSWMPVETYVPGTESTNVYNEGVYQMYELVLAVEGSIVTLSADQAELVFYPASQTTGSSVFVAGQAEALNSQACNFECASNWVNVATGQTSKYPPCDGDTAIFPTGNSYKVDVEGVVNVAALQFDGASVTSLADIPAYSVYPTGSNLQLFLADDANCVAAGTINPATGLCYCLSQCASAGQTFSSDAQLRAAVKAAANLYLQSALVSSNYPFSATFYVGLILQSMSSSGLSINLASDANCLFGSPTALTAAQAAITNYIQIYVPGSHLPDLSISFNANSELVTLSSNSFTSENRYFANLPSWTTNLGSITTEPVGNNMLLVQLWQAIYFNMQQCNINAETPTINSYFATCTTSQWKLPSPVCTALKTVLLNTRVASQNPASNNIVASLLNDVSTWHPSGTNPTFIPSATTYSFLDPLLMSNATVTTNLMTIVDAILPAVTKSPEQLTTSTAISSYLSSIISTFATRYSAILDARNYPSLTLTQTQATIAMNVGQNLPQADVNTILFGPNYQQIQTGLATYIAQNLAGTQPIVSMSANQVAFALGTNPATAQTCTPFNTVVSRRRQDNTGAAVNPLQVTYTYTFMGKAGCSASSTSFYCPINPSLASTSGSTYENVQQMLNDLTVAYAIPNDPTLLCANYSTQGTQLQNCLNNYCKSQFCSLANAGTPYVTLASGIQSCIAQVATCPTGGSCTDPVSQAYFASLAVTTIQYLNSTFSTSCAVSNAASTSGGSSSTVVGAAIGAVIGIIALVVLIIIAVVLMRRRNPGLVASAMTQKDRNVVAFENPMYDDPTQVGGSAAPVYDMSVAGAQSTTDGGEGLYDEPAFNANNQSNQPGHESRENPVYSSTGDLTEQTETEEGGGYLDVAGQDEE